MTLAITDFLSEIMDKLEEGGLPNTYVPIIAKKHGLYDPEVYYANKDYPHLYHMWCIKEEAEKAFQKMLNDNDDIVCSYCPIVYELMFGGIIPSMPRAKKIFCYKKPHYLPIYYSLQKRRAT